MAHGSFRVAKGAGREENASGKTQARRKATDEHLAVLLTRLRRDDELSLESHRTLPCFFIGYLLATLTCSGI